MFKNNSFENFVEYTYKLELLKLCCVITQQYIIAIRIVILCDCISYEQSAIISHDIIKNIPSDYIIFQFKFKNDFLLENLHIVKFHHLQYEMAEVPL